MHTRLLMSASAAFLLALGLITTFAPQELLAYAGSPPHPLLLLILEAAGALYLGFAMLNWMARHSLIGGIYSRPVALGNFLHFFLVAMSLPRVFARIPHQLGPHPAIASTIAILYLVFAAWFGLVVFGSPVPRRATESDPV